MDLEQKFRFAALSKLDEAEQLLDGHRFRQMRGMLNTRHPVEIADFIVGLVRKNEVSDGLEKLAEHDLLSYSVEQRVLDFAHPLFTQGHIDAANGSLFLTKSGASARLSRL